ncbi:MAG: outer membrane beta-barrel protein [Porphyromonas sp.]|uniref:outer membrane beta-barrel protein n=1 Tax=Porphyromonas sp. TaxID=1924944 RepID=UPI002A818CA3|nr:outer membrane beta-barrel protein [Porphyromonas sp.]MDY4244993.1 outer membrane beta-barrel protein [Porphyromonas sp.]
MNKKILLLCTALVALLSFNGAKAQVKDASVTVGGGFQYEFLDDALNIDNAMLWGVRAGFGFGPIVELRGVYDRSFGIKSKLNGNEWNVDPIFKDQMRDRKIDIERYGAELKFNLLDGYILAPYLLVGGGIQNMKYELPIADQKIETMKTDHLYFSGALGFKINLAPRVALNLSGNYLGFRTDLLNPYVNLEKASQKVDKHGLALMNNFSARAGLSVYLGGYDPRGGNEVSRAYRDFFSNGFRGMVFTIEPSILYMDFNQNSYWNTRDSWFYGGQVGVDFNNTFGVRGFYYQAGKPGKKLNFDFDKECAMYGGYFTGRLNLPRGVTPYINLGAGYLDAKLSEKATELDKANLHDVVFGMAGIGLEVPLFRYVSVFGSANFIAHPAPGVKTTTITKRSEILAKNMAYQFGVRFNLGKPARHYQFDTTVDEEVQDKVNEMRDKEYREYREYRYYGQDRDNDEYVRMTPSEIEDMAQRIIDRNRTNKKGHSCQKGNVNRQPNDDALTPLERELVHALIGNSPQYIAQQQMLANEQVKAQSATTTTTTTELTEQNEKILDRLDALDRKIEQSNQMRSQQPASTTTAVTTPPTHPAYQTPAASSAAAMNSDATPVDKNSNSLLKLNSVGLLIGTNLVKPEQENLFGTFAIGARAFMPISNTNLDFVPEIFVGFGKKTTLGISGNVVYNFNFKELGDFVPYLGAGVGGFTDTKLGVNFLVGTSYKLPQLNSAIFLDYGLRHSLRNHSVSLGYRFYF